MGLKEPFNSVSHMVGGGLAVIGLFVLIALADGALEIVSAVLYGLGLVSVYTFSSIYHGVPAGPRTEVWLERLDHVAIYLLIAGTYTPVTLILLGGGWGWSLFGTVWGISIIGIVLALTVPLGPKWIHITGYVALGWTAVVAAPVLWPLLSGTAKTLLVMGGVVYTVGALFYVWDRPRIVGRLGAHELWHLFVIGGSLLHFVFVAAYVL
ncbi:MAG: hemolysin III family protein [Euryarchaeota archaeon]|nr:hemolysin III family protein [Euryarchaeota archaeon]